MPEIAVADWVRRWFGSAIDSDDPREVVRPVLTFNSAQSTWREDDVLVLVVEDQGVWLWGVTDEGEYVERENADGVPWRPTGEDADAFWLHHAAFEAAWSRPTSRDLRSDRSTLPTLLAQLTPLPCGRWAWPGDGQQVYVRGECVVMVCEDGDDLWVVAGAPTAEDLAWLDEVPA